MLKVEKRVLKFLANARVFKTPRARLYSVTAAAELAHVRSRRQVNFSAAGVIGRKATFDALVTDKRRLASLVYVAAEILFGVWKEISAYNRRKKLRG